MVLNRGGGNGAVTQCGAMHAHGITNLEVGNLVGASSDQHDTQNRQSRFTFDDEKSLAYHSVPIQKYTNE
jgi:hypothetical protein